MRDRSIILDRHRLGRIVPVELGIVPVLLQRRLRTAHPRFPREAMIGRGRKGNIMAEKGVLEFGNHFGPGSEYGLRANDFLRVKKLWTLSAVLENAPLKGHPEHILPGLLLAIEQKDDQQASVLTWAYLRSFVDMVFEDLFEWKNRQYSTKQYLCVKGLSHIEGDKALIRTALDKAYQNVASQAKWLLNEISTLAPKKEENTRDLVLPQTKEVLYTELGHCWSQKANEELAGETIVFLFNCRVVEKEQGLVIGILKKAMDRDFPQERLGKHLRLFVESETKGQRDKRIYGGSLKQEIIRELSLAWGRHQDGPMRIARDYAVLEPIQHASEPAFELHSECVRHIAELESIAESIKLALYGDWKPAIFDSSHEIFGVVTFAYPHLFSEIKVTLSMRCNGWKGARDVNDLHVNFEKARTIIDEWRKRNKDAPKIHLFASSDDCPEFSRNCSL